MPTANSTWYCYHDIVRGEGGHTLAYVGDNHAMRNKQSTQNIPNKTLARTDTHSGTHK